MSTIEITDAQDGVTCPSCGVEDKSAYEWVGTEWEFHCKPCGATHEVLDRHASTTIWLNSETKEIPSRPCFEGEHGRCIVGPPSCLCDCHRREDPRVDTARTERHPVEDEIDKPWEDR